MQNSRRTFLRSASVASLAGAGVMGGIGLPRFAQALAGIGALSSLSAGAADTSGGYKALVCVFLNGGSDMHNWVVPTDLASYAEYAAVRRTLAVPRERLRAMSVSGQAAGRTFGFHPDLEPLSRMYEAQRLAVVANLGVLDRPTTKAQFLANDGLPSKLFSHNDQQSSWQSMFPEGASSGWGGRLADIMMAANNEPVFTAISATGNAIFLNGATAAQFQVAPSGPVSIPYTMASSVHNSSGAPSALASVLADPGTTDFQYEYARIIQRSIDASDKLTAAIAGSGMSALASRVIPVSTGASYDLAQESLAKQLNIVSRIMGSASSLGMRRQVFMVSLGGFDTHARQMRDQPMLMAKVANAIEAFMTSLDSVGLANAVTLFTASDFGRTLTSNGNGSDHGWGSHHFVVGGAVKGKAIYGTFPTTALNTATDVGSGRLLPTSPVVGHAATLAGWMGLSAAEQLDVLPQLSSFTQPAVSFL